MISGLIIIRYNIPPIIDLYLLASTLGDLSCFDNLHSVGLHRCTNRFIILQPKLLQQLFAIFRPRIENSFAILINLHSKKKINTTIMAISNSFYISPTNLLHRPSFPPNNMSSAYATTIKILSEST